MALQEFAWRVTASNLGKAVEIKTVIVVKFKLSQIIQACGYAAITVILQLGATI